MSSESEDLVVLLDEREQPCGAAPRATVHTHATPRHLAFSCYLFDERGRVLLTRRALTKATWPGVWTNSCCGHPRPGEEAEAAVRRRITTELGASVSDLRVVLPDFGYRAVDASGLVENEACPVWTGLLEGDLDVDPEEVCETVWLEWSALVDIASTVPRLLSPWCAAQVPLLAGSLRESAR